MHQANLNLITGVAQALAVPEDRFFRNIQRYGNTSSASLLIAAAEWRQQHPSPPAGPWSSPHSEPGCIGAHCWLTNP
jgi:3-oxoacyl-[acyl-carrier-protein] synthase III